MGDYSKLIVSCAVDAKIEKELREKIEAIPFSGSAYQSDEHVISIEPEKAYGSRSDRLNLVIVGQTKWGNGQPEFCEWLKPHVVQGSGENDVFAQSFSEYSDTPQVWKMRAEENEP